MTIEREQPTEIRRAGNIEIERTPDGGILKINGVQVEERDGIIIIQRHPKPSGFSKDQLLASPGEKDAPKNVDFVYDPASTEAGARQEKEILAQVSQAFGQMDAVATTPRKRGSEIRPLITQQFPEAQQDKKLDELLDDSGLGLLGESQYGAETYDMQETQKYFSSQGSKPARFGRGKYEEKRKALTYMESWVQHGYLPKDNKWKIENPEEFADRTTRPLVEKVRGKNFLMAHEANIITLHMLAERTPEEVKATLDKLQNLPEDLRQAVAARIGQARTFMDLYQAVREEIAQRYQSTETPKEQRGFHYVKALGELLEEIKLKSGTKGYGALSVYVVRQDPEGKRHLLEVAYDQQL